MSPTGHRARRHVVSLLAVIFGSVRLMAFPVTTTRRACLARPAAAMAVSGSDDPWHL